MLDDLKFINQKDHNDVLGATLREIRDSKDKELVAAATSWSADTPTAENDAKQLALELIGRPVVIIGDTSMQESARIWSTSIRMTAQTLSFVQNSDETQQVYLSWIGQPIDKQVALVFLRAEDELKQATENATFLLTKLSGRWPEPNIVTKSTDASNEYLAALGKTVASYVGMLNGATLMYEKLYEKAQK